MHGTSGSPDGFHETAGGRRVPAAGTAGGV